MANNPATEPRWKKALIKTLVALLRIAIGGTFVYSGFVKAIDIWGVGYKIDDYIEALGWMWAMPFSGIFSVALPIFEFLAGAMLLIGSFRRVTVIALLACMVFMLPLSAWIMIADPVPDCGCFGDAWVISNKATFLKNLALTIGLVYLLVRNKRLRSLYGPAVQWLTVVLPTVFIVPILFAGYRIQPLQDYRPYKIGTNLTAEAENESDDDFVFIYQKGNETKEFNVHNLPDTSWTFVDRREVEKPASHQEIEPITAYDSDESVVENLIYPQGITLLVLIPDISEINALTNFRLNDLNDLAADNDAQMICLTGSDQQAIDEWRTISMADYPVYLMDDSQLKQIARGNPAIVIIKDGVIRYKTTFVDFYSEFDTAVKGKRIDFNVWINEANTPEEILFSMQWLLVIAMGILLIINRTPLVVKFIHLQHELHHKKEDAEDKDF